MNRLSEATRQLKKDLETELGAGIDVKLAPHSDALDSDMLATLPMVVLQGPELPKGLERRNDYQEISTKTGVNGQNTELREVKQSRVFVDLSFRVRLFHNVLIGALDYVEKLILASLKIREITVNSTEESAVFSGNDPVEITIPEHGLFDGDSITISNSSDAAALADGVYIVTFDTRDKVTVGFDGTGTGGTCDVQYVSGIYDVHIDSDFVSDTVPNFSDLKHYESSAVIEDVKIESTEGNNVSVSKGPLNLELYKKD